MIDANQRWDVDEAIERVRALARFDLLWIEEPTSPDDVLGHAAIARGGAADRRGDRRALRQPDPLQAAAAGGGDRLLPDRQLPARRRQREPGGHPDGGEVRRPGLPARRRRRPVRAGAAPVDVRLHRASPAGWTIASPSSSITCTSTSSIPWSSAARATWRPPRRATAAKSKRSRGRNSGIRTVRYGRRRNARPDKRRYVPSNRVPHDGAGRPCPSQSRCTASRSLIEMLNAIRRSSRAARAATSNRSSAYSSSASAR